MEKYDYIRITLIEKKGSNLARHGALPSKCYKPVTWMVLVVLDGIGS
jgi:hypothetical protein